jgi:3-hydroxyisobutyrate dehydrogenase-like beta-hydroxyacid dehydrogenase
MKAMTQTLTLIGFGEAGSTFARAAGWEDDARAFDIRPVDFDAAAVRGCASLADALAGTPSVISVVTADNALSVAQDAAALIAPGTFFFDMNSVAPGTKRAAAAAIGAAGAVYIDVAVMAPVNPSRLATPLLLSGPDAETGGAVLAALGFTNLRIVGDDVGRASTIKMLRSVMVKGVEALTAECLIACECAGVTDEVLGSFEGDWATGADYRIDRMLVHGGRRAAEMAEVVKTLAALGIEPLMTRGTVARQAQLGGLGIAAPPAGLEAKLAKVRNAGQ